MDTCLLCSTSPPKKCIELQKEKKNELFQHSLSRLPLRTEVRQTVGGCARLLSRAASRTLFFFFQWLGNSTTCDIRSLDFQNTIVNAHDN